VARLTALNEPMMPSYNAETINYTYSLGNILNTADGATYTHDANGNRTSKTNGTNVTTYTYDSLNRLTQVVGGSRTIQYIYNGLGQRVVKIDNGVQTNYLVDPNGILPQVLAETDASNNLISFYVYDGAGLVAKITPANEYYFYHYDGLGSTIAITDSSGQVINTYCYSPEGLVGVQETIPNPFTYVGRFGVMAEGNGLYFMRARYYDPEVGRFINKDPIGYEGGMNLFTYVANNLVNMVDLLGLYWEYVQSTGKLYYVDNQTGARTPMATGHSGHGVGYNNPFAQFKPNVGPIPVGTYTIGSPGMHYSELTHKELPGSMRLTPKPWTFTFGRRGFLFHKGSYSTGCIVFDDDDTLERIAKRMARTGDTELRVVSYDIPGLSGVMIGY
jgi:RHS repeat-associated protein